MYVLRLTRASAMSYLTNRNLTSNGSSSSGGGGGGGGGDGSGIYLVLWSPDQI